MKKLSYHHSGRRYEISIPKPLCENLTFAKYLKHHHAELLRLFCITGCERIYAKGNAYTFEERVWDSNKMSFSECIEYRLTVIPLTDTKAPPTYKETIAMTHFTSVKEQIKHEIFGVDITTASKDELTELATFINKKIHAANSLQLDSSKYIQREIKTLNKLLDKVIAKLDEDVKG